MGDKVRNNACFFNQSNGLLPSDLLGCGCDNRRQNTEKSAVVFGCGGLVTQEIPCTMFKVKVKITAALLCLHFLKQI